MAVRLVIACLHRLPGRSFERNRGTYMLFGRLSRCSSPGTSLAKAILLLAVPILISSDQAGSNRLLDPQRVALPAAHHDFKDRIGDQSLYQAVRTARYDVHSDVPGGNSWYAVNDAHRLTATFTPEGIDIGVLEPSRHRLRIKLRAVGYAESMSSVGPGRLKANDNRLEIKRSIHDAELTEWYVNSPTGIEQGFTLAEPPGRRQRSSRLRLVMELNGNLRANATTGTEPIDLESQNGERVLRYEKLVVQDARGQTLPAAMGAANGELWIEIDDRDAAYPVVVDPTISQQAYLKASNTGMEDAFGWSVAISGETAVVGAVNEASSATGVNGDGSSDSAEFSGAAYVFVKSGNVWSQQAYLKAGNTGANDSFGHSVAISGDLIVIGAPYEDSSATGVNGNVSNNAVSDSGAAYVFVRSGGVWSQQAYLKASNTGTGDRFGYSVAVSGETVVVGADAEDSSSTGINGPSNNLAADSGAAYVFTRSAGIWSQQAFLKASNTGSGDAFGWSLGISGNTIAGSAPFEDSAAVGVNGNGADESAESAGAAYVFLRTGTVWSQQAYLKASNAQLDDQFGYSIAIAEETVVVGAVGEDSNATVVNGDSNNDFAPDSGAAYAFFRSGSVWSQQAYFKASNAGEADFFGNSVAISGASIIVGAPFEASSSIGVDGSGANELAPGSGAAYAFERPGGFWNQQAYLKASNTSSGDRFGYSVGVSGGLFVVGADSEDSSAIGTNADQNNDAAAEAGAVYVFTPGEQQPRALGIAGATITAGTSGNATVVMQTQGDENTLSFSLAFNTSRLSFVSAALAPGLPPGTSFSLDSSFASGGFLGVTVTLPFGQALTAGGHQLVTVTFNALSNAATGATPINFTDVPTGRAIRRPDSEVIPIQEFTFTAGTVTIVPPITSRSVRAVGATIPTGGSGSIAIEIDAIANENSLSGSLTFDTTKLSFVSATLATVPPGASLNVNTTQLGSGQVGLIFDLPANQALQAGTRHLVNVTLSALQAAAPGPSLMTFSDSPIARKLVDTGGGDLPATFAQGTVTIALSQILEADTSPRPNGSGSVSLADWVQTGRFAVALDTITSTAEFMRADCAPRETLGNGALSLADWVQAGRYAIGLDPVVTAGGPTGPPALTGLMDTERTIANSVRHGLWKRTGASVELRSSLPHSGASTTEVLLNSSGTENAMSFSLSFDPTQWKFAGIEAGRDVSAATVIVNSHRLADGRVGIALALRPGQSMLAGWRTVVEVRFERRKSTLSRASRIVISDDEPVMREVVDVAGKSVHVDWK